MTLLIMFHPCHASITEKCCWLSQLPKTPAVDSPVNAKKPLLISCVCCLLSAHTSAWYCYRRQKKKKKILSLLVSEAVQVSLLDSILSGKQLAEYSGKCYSLQSKEDKNGEKGRNCLKTVRNHLHVVVTRWKTDNMQCLVFFLVVMLRR